MRGSEQTEFILLEGKQPSGSVGCEEQTVVAIAGPSQRPGPIAVGKVNRGAANFARSNIEAPKSRTLILSEYSGTTDRQMATTRHLSDDSDPPGLYIHGEQVIRGYAYDDISRLDGDGVN